MFHERKGRVVLCNLQSQSLCISGCLSYAAACIIQQILGVHLEEYCGLPRCLSLNYTDSTAALKSMDKVICILLSP